MLIDWFTVAAQSLNFIVLVWLLKRFLYQPILNAIDAREQRIARELADADAAKSEAERERASYQQKNQTLDQQRQTLLQQASDAASAERDKLMAQARSEMQTLQKTLRQQLQHELQTLQRDIAQRSQQEVFAIARKLLKELANAELEAQITGVFVDRLKQMDEATRTAVIKLTPTPSEPALIRSAFELPAAQKTAIERAVSQLFGKDIAIKFATAPTLTSGIELINGGQKISWTIAHHLAELEHNLRQLSTVSSLPTVPANDREPQP